MEKQKQTYSENKLAAKMGRIKHKILVISGKGGVGKSTVAVNLAVSLALRGKKVGILDIDLHGPSVPKILNLEGARPVGNEGTIDPVHVTDNLSAMSIGFLVPDKDSPVIWRGPMKYNMIKQFLEEVEWSDLDYLIVDSPPGTGDEPLAVAQLIQNADGAVVVTTPQQLALADVRRSITFCRQLDLPVLGVIENMSGFLCPHCRETVNIFKSGGGEAMSGEMKVPFLGKIPVDPLVVESCDSGRPYIENYKDTAVSKIFDRAVSSLTAGLEKNG